MLIQNYRKIKINTLGRVSAEGSRLILVNGMKLFTRLIFKVYLQNLCFDSKWPPFSNCFAPALYGRPKWRCIELFRKSIVLLRENGLGRGKFIPTILETLLKVSKSKILYSGLVVIHISLVSQLLFASYWCKCTKS